MRKIVLWCLSLALLMGSVSFAVAEEAVVPPEGIQAGTEIVVGTATAITGHFGMDMWGSNTADMDVRALLHGYETVSWTKDQGLALNPTVVKQYGVRNEGDGSRSFQIEIYDDLTYNDGTPITARDYVFSILLSASAEIVPLGGARKTMGHLFGAEDYQAGDTATLAGVRLVSDYMFTLTIPADFFPYFYGLAMLGVRPLPISVIAPDCEVLDEGRGAYISGENFTTETLQQTLLDPEEGYVFNPKVTCGAYSLESYDAEAGEATFVANELFKGDYTLQTPRIERLVYRHVSTGGMIDELSSGNIDLLNKVMDSEAVAQGRALISEDGPIRMNTHLRTGFGFLAFACEQPTVESDAVRRAIAMAIDKDALIDADTQHLMLRSYGYYGLGQWMATYEEEDFSAAEALEALDVPVNTEEAQALLEEDGWVLDAADGIRYKEIDGAKTALSIRWAYADDNPLAAKLLPLVEEGLAAIGVQLEATELPFAELLAHYYRQEERTYDMFFLASNFNYIYDPYLDFNTADAYQGMVNTTGLRDETLMDLALEMRQTDADDLRGYVEKWLAFQERFVEMMPMVPLYTNVYTDFYNERLQSYDTTGSQTWSQAILYAYIEE